MTLKRFLAVASLASLALVAAVPAFAQKVRLATTAGDIVVELDAAKAPKTVANFVQYVKDGHYDGTIFHRVIENFMIQGGGFNAAMEEKKVLTPALKNEADNEVYNTRGSIAMARTMDPHSARVQFFINLKRNAFLDFRSPTQAGYGYTVFGKVTEGMDVVDAIATVPTGNHGDYQNVPQTPVIIKSAKILSDK